MPKAVTNLTSYRLNVLTTTKKVAFTLAEVLITLAIIGVVATMIIPTLITTNQEKGWNTAATVFERKLEESLKVMNTQQTLAGYRTTEDFVAELSKHLKITKICKNDDILSCFEDKVFWGAGEATPEEVDMTKVKTAKHFGLDDWDTDLVGVQLANGTSGVIAYNPACKQDPYSNQVTGRDCIAVLYDTSGFTKPNTSGKDLRSINVSKLGSSCAFEIGGTCYGTPFYPEYMTFLECTGGVGTPYTTTPAGAEAQALGIKQCYFENDYWAGAVKTCGGTDKMPTLAQLAEIANYIYETDQIGAQTNWRCPSGNCRNDDKASALGFNVPSGSAFWVWSGSEYSSGYGAFSRDFDPTLSKLLIASRGNYQRMAVCLGD